MIRSRPKLKDASLRTLPDKIETKCIHDNLMDEIRAGVCLRAASQSDRDPVPRVPGESVPIPAPSPGTRVPGHKSHGIQDPLPIPDRDEKVELELGLPVQEKVSVHNLT